MKGRERAFLNFTNELKKIPHFQMISKMFQKLKKKRESFELIEGDFRIWFGLREIAS